MLSRRRFFVRAFFLFCCPPPPPHPSLRPFFLLDSLRYTQQMGLSLLSAIASVFIIVSFWKFGRLYTFAFKVIMMLAVANLCLDTAYLVGSVGHDK